MNHTGTPTSADDTPRTAQLRLDHTIPGWTIHAALGAITLIGFLALVTGLGLVAFLPWSLSIAAVAGAHANMLRPSYAYAASALTVITAVYALSAPTGYTWKTPLTILVLHTIVRLSWLGTHAGPSTRIDRALLLDEARRSATFNLLGQLLAILLGAVTALTTRTDDPLTLPWLVAAGGTALLALAVLLRHGLPNRAAERSAEADGP